MQTQVAPQQRKRPTRTFAEYFWILKKVHNFYPDVCVDAGAASGTPAIYRAFPGSMHIAIEPLSDQLPALKICLKDTAHEIHNVAVMEKPGTAVIRKPDNLLTASLMSASTASGHGDTAEIKISTLDRIMEPHLNAGKILLKTDCQGTDLDALRGGMETLKRSEVVIVEVSFFRYWGSHQADLYDVVEFMKSKGFVVHDILDGLFRPYDRSLGQVDLAFVKENGMFRQKAIW